ncbi:hypothetical protein HAX54_019268 [Datura stramonium]|uniref:Uncharacterized protein n=1 Tax=Datura stramonium TaxID=4076 RepID=A0ABS8S3V8_DATST|nr:hypothetical protein [Datura stramonium]
MQPQAQLMLSETPMEFTECSSKHDETSAGVMPGQGIPKHDHVMFTPPTPTSHPTNAASDDVPGLSSLQTDLSETSTPVSPTEVIAPEVVPIKQELEAVPIE